MILGLTGGIATGKSTVSNMIKDYGIPVVDADEIARGIVDCEEVKERLIKEFGKNVYINGKLDRKRLGEIVFSDRSKLDILNEITHPFILNKIRDEFRRYSGEKLVVGDIPLLFEVGFEKEVDVVLTVYCSKDIQISRLMRRNGYSKDEALKRIKSQMSVDEKVKRSDYILNNNGTYDELKNQLEKIIYKIKKEVDTKD